MEPGVDAAFIRRAVELADLNAVRVALYQHTGDPELAALPVAAQLDEAGRELLVALDEESQKLLLLQDEGAPDKNYYVNEFGRMQVNAPWYGPEYQRMCSSVDWDDVQLT